MIRRDITLDDGTASWLLISQVEHARISGELARAWNEPYPEEVIEAIKHHDDGWAKWEAAPQLDPVRGRPLSFTEMAVTDAIYIWNGSIAAARQIGPLAGAIVAGHFISLASGSEHAKHPLIVTWRRDTIINQGDWLLEWQDLLAANTLAAAERAQNMLLTADLLSLWLSMDGPITSSDSAAVPNSEMQSRTSMVLGKYCFTTHEKSATHGEIAWQGSLQPWPFAGQDLNFAAPAVAVPASHYASWSGVAAASRPIKLHWQLRQTLPPGSEC